MKTQGTVQGGLRHPGQQAISEYGYAEDDVDQQHVGMTMMSTKITVTLVSVDVMKMNTINLNFPMMTVVVVVMVVVVKMMPRATPVPAVAAPRL